MSIAVESKHSLTTIVNTECLKRQATQPPLFVVCLCGNFPSVSLLAPFTSSPPVVSWPWQSALSGRKLHPCGG